MRDSHQIVSGKTPGGVGSSQERGCLIVVMNERERYIETLLFGTPDKIPFQPGKPREKTLKRWHSEGLPENRHWFDFLCETIGIETGTYHKDTLQPGVNFRMIPWFDEKVLEHNPKNHLAWFNLGNSYDALGKFRRAVQCFDRAIALDPDNPEYYYNKGVILYEKGRLIRAKESFDRALALNPMFREAAMARDDILKDIRGG